MSRADERVESAPPTPSRHKYAWCEDAIIKEIITPYLVGLIRTHQPTSKTQLLQLFRESSGYTTCSQTTLDTWLSSAGISTHRRMEFDLPAPQPTPTPDPQSEFGEASAGGGPSGPPASAPPTPKAGGIQIPGFNLR